MVIYYFVCAPADDIWYTYIGNFNKQWCVRCVRLCGAFVSSHRLKRLHMHARIIQISSQMYINPTQFERFFSYCLYVFSGCQESSGKGRNFKFLFSTHTYKHASWLSTQSLQLAQADKQNRFKRILRGTEQKIRRKNKILPTH